MVTANELKKGLSSLYDIFDTIQIVAVINLDRPLREVLKKDLMEFTMHMAGLDGEIKPEEAKLISDIFDVDMNEKEIYRYMLKEGVSLHEYKQKAPAIIQVAVQLDNMDIIGEESLAEVIFETFQMAGKLIAEADGQTHRDEYDGWHEYIDNMNSYINDNINNRKRNLQE